MTDRYLATVVIRGKRHSVCNVMFDREGNVARVTTYPETSFGRWFDLVGQDLLDVKVDIQKADNDRTD